MVDAPQPTEGRVPSAEYLRPQNDPKNDAERIIRHSFLYDAKQVGLTQDKKNTGAIERTATIQGEHRTTLNWIDALNGLPENPMYAEGQDVRANRDGTISDRDTFIRLWEESDPEDKSKKITQAEPSLKGAEMPKGSQNYRLTHIVGRADGNFHCQVEINGKIEHKVVPEHIVMTSFICAQSESLLSTMGPKQRQIFEMYLKQIKKPDEQVQFEAKAITEAASESGQITTDALLKFLERRYPKKDIPPAPMEGASEEDQKKYNDEVAAVNEHNRRVDARVGTFREQIADHIVASHGDMVELMRIHGPDVIAETKQQLEVLQQNKDIKREQFARLQGTAQGTQLEEELRTLDEQISLMEKALDTYKDPEATAQVLMMVQQGEFSPSAGRSINHLISQGKMNEAMEAAIDEQIKNLPDDSEERAKLEQRKKIAMMIGGGGLLILFMLITQGMSSARQ